MPKQRSRTLPDDLRTVLRQFTEWRRQRTGRSRIPEELWAAAAQTAATHGVHFAARTLRLNASALKQRLDASPAGRSAAPRPSKSFLELTWPPTAGPVECVLEIERPGGDKMRIRLTGGPPPDLAALSAPFWRGTP